MHWNCNWWETEIVADDENDKKLLKQLEFRLSRKPRYSYESESKSGELETSDRPDQDPSVGFTLTFNR